MGIFWVDTGERRPAESGDIARSASLLSLIVPAGGRDVK
jgi:hypothetical protein